MPTQKEMGKFEQLIRRSPVPIPPVARPVNVLTKVFEKKPIPPPPMPEPVQPEPVTMIEPEYAPEYIPEHIPEIPQVAPSQSQPVIKKQVRSAFDLPFNPGNVIDKKRYVPIHIPPAVTEPLVIPDTIQRTTDREVPLPEPTVATQPAFPHRPKPVPAPVITPVSIPANIIAERVPIIPERVYEYPDTAAIYGRVSNAPTRTEFQNTPLHLPKLNFSYQTGLITTFFIVRIVLGVVMVGFGIYTGGSYYGPNIGKFSGDLSTLFYRYQLGMIIAFAGMIIIYDALRFRIRK